MSDKTLFKSFVYYHNSGDGNYTKKTIYVSPQSYSTFNEISIEDYLQSFTTESHKYVLELINNSKVKPYHLGLMDEASYYYLLLTEKDVEDVLMGRTDYLKD